MVYTKFSHYTDEELVSVAYGLISPEDELAFEFLQRLEQKVSESVTDDNP